MGYEGEIAAISLGKGGMWTDSPQTAIPNTHLIFAQNCQFFFDVLEKEAGSQRWNATTYAAGIKAFRDFWPTEILQKIIVVAKNGQVYYSPSQFVTGTVAPTGAAPATLNVSGLVSILLAGNEEQGNDRKCFILTGNDPVQVISGNVNTRANITTPSIDWTGTNQPFGGALHRNSLWLFGNRNNPHGIYRSSALDHEDFSASPSVYPVYPGEGEKVICAYVFRNRLYVLKYPKGAYQLDDSDSNPVNWFFTKFTDDFGGSSPFCMQTVLDDVIVANNFGSLTSGKAALIFGDLATADIFHQNNVYGFAENEIRKDIDLPKYLLYYPSKKTLFASFQSTSSQMMDRICRLDYKQYPNAPAKISWTTKDQPNCLGLVKDSQKVERPFYGADDGYLYQMDVEDRWVGDQSGNETGYEFAAWTPAMDFGQANALLAQQNKLFDFLEIEFEPTGDWDLSVDIFIDGKFYVTRYFNMSGRSNLDEFVLDNDFIDDGTPFSVRLPIGGMGRRIQFRMHQNGVGQNVRLTGLKIFYRISGQQATAK